MIKLFDYILDLIYPPKCVFCGKVIDKSDICNDCIKTLPYTKGDSVYQRFPFVDKMHIAALLQGLCSPCRAALSNFPDARAIAEDWAQ